MKSRASYLLKTLPPHRLAAKAAAKAGRAAARAAEELWRGLSADEPSDAKIAARIKRMPGEEAGALDATARLEAAAAKARWPHGAGGAAFVDGLARRFGLLGEADREEADAALEGRLKLPGGRFAAFGEPISWRRDPIADLEHAAVYWKRVDDARGDADILNVWWPGSFYHLAPLGKAHLDALRRGDRAAAARYARAYEAHVESFRDQNPPGLGPNWRSTAIVSLRLVHLIWAEALFSNRADKTPGFGRRVIKDIYIHAAHIRRHLEWFPVRTNHYLVNLYALYLTATLFPEFREAESWRRFALRELSEEVLHHLRPDGVSHEGSTGYHRFVVEIFLSAVLLADGLGEGGAFGWNARARLSAALDFLRAALRPDGAPPQVGDAADIRLHHLDQRNVLADMSPLFQLGAIALDRPDLKAAAPQLTEYAYWLLGPIGAAAFDTLGAAPPHAGLSRALAPDDGAGAEVSAFGEGGFAFARAPRQAWLMLRAGPLALDGVAGHGHYDQLSFELWFDDEPILIDPGWRQYGGDRAAFAYFKATAAHNTVLVDGADQIEMDLFIHPPPPRPTPSLDVAEKTPGGGARLSGTHALYSHLDDPVTHRRQLTLSPAARRLDIDDRLDAQSRHTHTWRFHFAPGVTATLAPGGGVGFRTTSGRTGRVICLSGEPAATLEAGWCAPRYGERRETALASFELSASGAVHRRFVVEMLQESRA